MEGLLWDADLTPENWSSYKLVDWSCGLAPFFVSVVMLVSWVTEALLWPPGQRLPGRGCPGRCGDVRRCSAGATPPSIFSRASSKDKNQLSLRHSARSLALKASIVALSVGLPGRLKSNSMPPMTVEICEIGQLAGPWQLERTVGAVQRDAASASSLAAIHAGTGPPKGSPRCVSRGLATSSFGWGGAHANYTARTNLSVKVLDSVQDGGGCGIRDHQSARHYGLQMLILGQAIPDSLWLSSD